MRNSSLKLTPRGGVLRLKGGWGVDVEVGRASCEYADPSQKGPLSDVLG